MQLEAKLPLVWGTDTSQKRGLYGMEVGEGRGTDWGAGIQLLSGYSSYGCPCLYMGKNTELLGSGNVSSHAVLLSWSCRDLWFRAEVICSHCCILDRTLQPQ